MAAQEYIRWFQEVGKEDIALVGGKGANLGEMVSMGLPVPPGFIVTSKAYFYFLSENKLEEKIKEALSKIRQEDPQSFSEASAQTKKIILQGRMPRDLALEIMKAYLKLGGNLNSVLVSVRSSATAEDLPTASFAGQQATFLNIKGEVNVVKKVQECWASLFEARAIFYRGQHNFNHLKIGIAVPVQKMIQSEVSGVMFTADPLNQEKNRLVIEAVYGLGELIVQGTVTPDRYLIEKHSLVILRKEVSNQLIQLIKVGALTKKVRVPKVKQNRQKLINKQIKDLAKIGKKIHQHYFFPQDIEWAVEKGKIYLLQTRPITTLGKIENRGSKIEKEPPLVYHAAPVILTGIPASPGIATGPVKIINSAREIHKVSSGDVLVTPMTTPDFVPVMKKVAAIITDKGGQTSHAAIVSRELGIPCVVGTEKATKIFKNDQFVTVNGKTGEIYKATVIRDKQQVIRSPGDDWKQKDLSPITYHLSPLKTATKIYVNLAEPELAADVSKKNVDGVGLLRAEFMLAQLGIHPKKLIHDRKQKLFINHLANGVRTFCEHFEPRPVIYRATDFKTNEYRNLTGGKLYEPEEANPMLGYRGAYRYLSDPQLFEMELEALKRVRRDFKNLHLMIPFVSQPWELAEVKKIVASNGLLRSPTFKLWMMAEIPSNVILLEDFIKIGIDGISIGSNDLTMLILGVDRDNSDVAPIFNEQDPAVLWALEKIIKTCHKYKITSSICGQAPSLHFDLIRMLVEWGITSISVNADIVDQARQVVYEAEELLVKKRHG